MKPRGREGREGLGQRGNWSAAKTGKPQTGIPFCRGTPWKYKEKVNGSDSNLTVVYDGEERAAD